MCIAETFATFSEAFLENIKNKILEKKMELVIVNLLL